MLCARCNKVRLTDDSKVREASIFGEYVWTFLFHCILWLETFVTVYSHFCMEHSMATLQFESIKYIICNNKIIIMKLHHTIIIRRQTNIPCKWLWFYFYSEILFPRWNQFLLGVILNQQCFSICPMRYVFVYTSRKSCKCPGTKPI